MRKQRTALIDCDMVAYRCSGMVASNSGDAKDLEDIVPAVIRTWANEAFCEDIILCKGTRSFRCDVYPEYKANRKDKPKPPLLPEARKVIDDLDWKAKRIAGLEADDIQGIIATSEKDKYVIVNNDKDMLTIANVLVYDPDKMDFPEYTAYDTAWRNLWIQIMTGDPTDNYKGIPKCGPVKANKILDDPDNMYYTYAEVVAGEYEGAGLTREYLLQMCRCARILDSSLWNRETKTFTLWNPYE